MPSGIGVAAAALDAVGQTEAAGRARKTSRSALASPVRWNARHGDAGGDRQLPARAGARVALGGRLEQRVGELACARR